MTVIGFIGLGHMGGPMAANLHAAGYDVRAFDLSPAALEAARTAGLSIAESADDAASNADVVITMLPAGKHVIGLYGGDDDRPGILDAAPDGTLFIDCSTIAVDDARAARDLAVGAGHRQIDAPVSGGVVGAENATLAFMVGGETNDVEAARPILERMGARIVHCGGAGLGQAAKVCNNMILAISQIAVAEAFVLGERLGLEHQALFDVAANASGQCWALTTNCPVPGPVPTSPANRDYRPGFSGALMAKDLGLAGSAIKLTGTDARLGELARSIYDEFAADGGDRLDFSAIIHTIRASGSKEQPA